MIERLKLDGKRWLVASALALSCFTAASAAPLERPAPLSSAEFAAEVNGQTVFPDAFAERVEGITRADAPSLFIVRLPEPALARYQGEIQGLASPGRTDGGRLDVNSSESLAYVEFLEMRQRAVLADAGQLLGRTVEAPFQFQHAFNGMAIEASAEEVEQLLARGLIEHAEPYIEYPLLTDAGPEWIGSPAVWSGEAIGAEGSLGEGVVVGIIDSGINLGHPSFAAEAEDGFVHTNPLGSGNFIGWCNPGVGGVTDTCNDKLIGTWEFLGGLGLDGLFIPGGEDENGHGTHVAGTVVGNPLESNFGAGANPPVSGVAPRANVIAYDACYTNEQGQGLCPNVSTLASINQVVADGIVDVINYSIGGGTEPWEQAISLAFLAAVDAGVFVSASAGNSGPGPNTMGHLQPWVASVAAASHNRYFADATVSVTDADAPADLIGLGAVPSLGPAPDGEEAALAVDPTNLLGCSAFEADFFDGQIAYVDRGECGFADKIVNATNAGAVGVVVGNSNATAPIVMGATEGTTIPAVMVTRAAGDALLAFIDGNEATVRLDSESPAAVVLDDSVGDIITGFSSRGPNPFNLVKPSVTAPGSQILAAVEAGGGEGAPEFGLKSGTSMSSPHNAGAAALLRALNPTWLPSEIQSALMLTARTGILADNGGPIEPATIFDEGAGRIQVDRAAATPLVLRETPLNFFLANPADGGDPRTLNLAGISDNNCVGSCSFQRTFRSVADGPRSFELSLDGDSGLQASFSPASFTLLPGQLQTVEIQIDAIDGNDDWRFAQLLISQIGDNDAPDVVFADRFQAPEADDPTAAEPLSMPVSILARGAVIDVDESPVVAAAEAGASVTETIDVANIGGAALDWVANASEFQPGNTLRSQAGNTGNAIVSGFFTDLNPPAGAYSAEVFELDEPATLGRLFFEGFVSGGLPLAGNTSGVRFAIYADAAGVPAGNPEDGENSALWSAELPNPVPGLDLANSDISLDLIAAGLELPQLEAGRYWVTVAPEFPTPDPRWNWFNATNGDIAGDAQIISPGGVFGGIANWSSLPTTVSPDFANLSFAIDEAVTCGADWLTVEPSSDTVAPGDVSTVSLVFDASDLASGSYETQLCLSSNDSERPLVLVPVRFEVSGEAGTAELQVAHLAPFADALEGTAVNIALNGDVVLSEVLYGDSTGYLTVPAGEALVEIFPVGSDTAAISASATLLDGERYLAVARGNGTEQELGLTLLNDDLEAPASGNFALRLGHLAPFAGGAASAEVRLADGSLVQAVDFADVTGFLELPAGSYDLVITGPDGEPALIDPIELTFEGGEVLSAFAVGDGSNQPLGVFALPVGGVGGFLPLNQPDARNAVVEFDGIPSPELACSLANIDQMPSVSLDIGAFAYVNGLAWETVLETVGGSWASEALILIGSTSDRIAIALTPAVGVDEPTAGPEAFSGQVPDLAAADLDFSVDQDGLVWLSFCETFVDPVDPNAVWVEGSMTINPDDNGLTTAGSAAVQSDLPISGRR
ncbi:MAG: S8 family serine peptidase [Wenzhouxiangella sp.]